MNKYRMGLGLLCVICSCHIMAVDKKECVAAVDAADSMNVNQPTDCDYSKEGLNGYLHKAFSQSKEEAAPLTAAKPPSPLVKNAEAAGKFRVEVEQWAAIPLARNQLLPEVMEVCRKGFRLLAEEYRPLGMGRVAIELKVECLEQ